MRAGHGKQAHHQLPICGKRCTSRIFAALWAPISVSLNLECMIWSQAHVQLLYWDVCYIDKFSREKRRRWNTDFTVTCNKKKVSIRDQVQPACSDARWSKLRNNYPMDVSRSRQVTRVNKWYWQDVQPDNEQTRHLLGRDIQTRQVTTPLTNTQRNISMALKSPTSAVPKRRTRQYSCVMNLQYWPSNCIQRPQIIMIKRS